QRYSALPEWRLSATTCTFAEDKELNGDPSLFARSASTAAATAERSAGAEAPDRTSRRRPRLSRLVEEEHCRRCRTATVVQTGMGRECPRVPCENAVQQAERRYRRRAARFLVRRTEKLATVLSGARDSPDESPRRTRRGRAELPSGDQQVPLGR